MNTTTLTLTQLDIDPSDSSGDNKSRDHKIQSLWHDRDNQEIWGVDADNDGTADDFDVWKLDYSVSETEPTVTEIGTSTGANANSVYAYDIFKINNKYFVSEKEHRPARTFNIWQVDSAPFVLIRSTNFGPNFEMYFSVIIGTKAYIWHTTEYLGDYDTYLAIFNEATGLIFWDSDNIADYKRHDNRNLHFCSYDESNILYFIATSTADSKNYLLTYKISGDSISVEGKYDIALSLDRNTDSTVIEALALEKGFHLTEMKVFQISRLRGHLNYIANWLTSRPSNNTIVAITDSYIIINNNSTIELWEYIDIIGTLVFGCIINTEERMRPSLNLEYLKKADEYSDPPTKDQFVQVFGKYTSDQLTDDITYRGEENFSGITTTAKYYKGSGGFNYETVGENAPDWIDEDLTEGASKFEIIAEIGNHKNVLQCYVDAGDTCRGRHTHTATILNTYEFWVAMDDVSKGTYIFFLESGGGLGDINKLGTVEFIGSNLRVAHGDGVGGHTFTNLIVPAVNDTMYHIKVLINCTTDTISVWLDGVLKVDAKEFFDDHTVTTSDSIVIYTTEAGSYSLYIDGFGIVDEVDPESYTYVETYNINGYDIDELLDAGYVLMCAFNGSYIKTNTLIGSHVDVLEMYDNQGNIAYGDYVQLNIPFVAQTNGTAELFIRSTDANEYCTVDMLEGTTVKIRLFIHADKFYKNDGAVTEICAAVDNTWYHVRIAFESGAGAHESLAADKWKVFIDGVEYGDYNFLSVADELDSIQFASDATHSTHTFYIDGVDFSWATGYRLNRNWAKTLTDQVIFEGLVKDYDLNILREIFVVSRAKELNNITPNITSYTNYTGKTSGAIITQLISDYCKYITAGTISDGSITWTCPDDWEARGDKSFETIINDFADAENFMWSIRPTGELDFNDGTVSSHVTFESTDSYFNPFAHVLSQDINQVIVYGGITALGVQMGPYTADDEANQQLHGIVPWLKRYSAILDATNLQTLADNKLLLQGSAPLIYQVERQMGASGDFGLVQVGELWYIDSNVRVEEKSDEYVTVGTYTLNLNDFDVKNNRSELKLVDGILFIEQVLDTLPQQNSQLIQQNTANVLALTTRIKDIWIPADALRAPGLKPASFVSHGISGVWEFSDEVVANEETISGNVKLEYDMDLTVAPTFLVGWSSTTTSAECYWQLEYLYTGLDEDTTTAAQETKLSAETSSNVAEGLIITTFTLQVPASTDKCIHFRLKRRSASAEDTINGDTVEVHGVCLSYTADIMGAS